MTKATKRLDVAGPAELIYDDYGDGERVVLLLHGGSGTRHSWLDVPDRLSRTYRVLVPDLRGHGESSHPGSYRIEEYAGDVAAILELGSAAPAALVGHSLGGIVAAQVAGTRPDLVDRAFFEDPPLQWTSDTQPLGQGSRRFDAKAFRTKVDAKLDDGADDAELAALILQEAMETNDFFRPRQQLMFAQRDRGASRDDLVAGFQAMFGMFGDQLTEAFPPALIGTLVDGLLACDPGIFDVGNDWLDAYDPARPMTCLVHMLRADPAFGPPPIGAAFPPEAVDGFLAMHPKATVEFVEGASHAIHFQMPDRFMKSLEAFLAR